MNLLRVMVEMPAGPGASNNAPTPMRRGRTPLQRLLQRMSLMHTHSEYVARARCRSCARLVTHRATLVAPGLRYVDQIDQLLVRWASLRALWWFRAKLKPVCTRVAHRCLRGCPVAVPLRDLTTATRHWRAAFQVFVSALRGEFDINPQFATNALGVFQHATHNGHVLAGDEVSTKPALRATRSVLTFVPCVRVPWRTASCHLQRGCEGGAGMDRVTC